MEIFDFTDYKEFIRKRIEALPKKGFGTYRKLADHLGINSVMVSQIFKGTRDLTPEQALSICEYFGFNDLATEYFINLVQFARAGTHQYKTRIQKRLARLKEKSKDLRSRIKTDVVLTEEVKAVFYSQWYFSAIRLATTNPNYRSVENLASRFNLTPSLVNRVTEFLIQHGLCIAKDGLICIGPQRTHVGNDSLLMNRHHLNWRTKAIINLDHSKPDHLHYTGPMALSEEAAKEVRKELVALIERIAEKVVKTESETLACLNIDWFNY